MHHRSAGAPFSPRFCAPCGAHAVFIPVFPPFSVGTPHAVHWLRDFLSGKKRENGLALTGGNTQ
jgi:hypothetical protein